MQILPFGLPGLMWIEKRVFLADPKDKPGRVPGWPGLYGWPIPDNTPIAYKLPPIYRWHTVNVLSNIDFSGEGEWNANGERRVRTFFKLMGHVTSIPDEKETEVFYLSDLLGFSISSSDQWDGDTSIALVSGTYQRPIEHLVLADLRGGRARVVARHYGAKSEVVELRARLEADFIYSADAKRLLREEVERLKRFDGQSGTSNDHDPV